MPRDPLLARRAFRVQPLLALLLLCGAPPLIPSAAAADAPTAATAPSLTDAAEPTVAVPEVAAAPDTAAAPAVAAAPETPASASASDPAAAPPVTAATAADATAARDEADPVSASATAVASQPEAQPDAMPQPESWLPSTAALADYRALAAREARNYDQTQDISPRQLLLLLEVSERVGADLGRAVATGEFESARTWNDFVRPTLGNGQLGSASGVWQFIPSTFHHIIRVYGDQMLAASAADPARGRAALDLGSGPFNDFQVRRLIRETVAGARGADDDLLQLLRHNFAVLAFAKHFLSRDSGATNALEDYLFHFLGEQRGREVLALARGPARHTLTVKPRVVADTAIVQATPALESAPQAALSAVPSALSAAVPSAPPSAAVRAVPQAGAAEARALDILRQSSQVARYLPAAPLGAPRDSAIRGLHSELEGHALRYRVRVREPEAATAGVAAEPSADVRLRPSMASASASAPAPALTPRYRPAPVAAPYGLPADSPVVTGNLGMFYRDGAGQTQAYTWAQFLDRLAQRVRAQEQPAMVRAKFGVGFALEGGDTATWRRDPAADAETLALYHPLAGSLELAKTLIAGPLTAAEIRSYKAALLDLTRSGDDQPLAELPPTAVAALRHLGLLPRDLRSGATSEPAVREALAAWRRLVGKAPPDDPALADRLLPAERAALAVYDQRVTRYAGLQAAQRQALAGGLDTARIKRMLAAQRTASVPHMRRLQRALAEEGLQTQVGGAAVRAARGGSKTAFDGIVGPLTLKALEGFQRRNGLLPTAGVLDRVTLALLGLPPMGCEVFQPPVGPQCPSDAVADSIVQSSAAPSVEPSGRVPSAGAAMEPDRGAALSAAVTCALPVAPSRVAFYHPLPRGKATLPAWLRTAMSAAATATATDQAAVISVPAAVGSPQG